LKKKLKGSDEFARTVAFNPNQNQMASGSYDGYIRVWNTDSWSLVKKFYAHSEAIKSVSFSQNGLLASGSSDCSIKIYKTQTWELIKELDAHKEEVINIRRL